MIQTRAPTQLGSSRVTQQLSLIALKATDRFTNANTHAFKFVHPLYRLILASREFHQQTDAFIDKYLPASHCKEQKTGFGEKGNLNCAQVYDTQRCIHEFHSLNVSWVSDGQCTSQSCSPNKDIHHAPQLRSALETFLSHPGEFQLLGHFHPAE